MGKKFLSICLFCLTLSLALSTPPLLIYLSDLSQIILSQIIKQHLK